MNRTVRILAVSGGTLLAGLVTWAANPSLADVFLPGTQPSVIQPVEPVTMCFNCHQWQGNGLQATIGNEWKGSMMAHSARDPIFYAAMAVANKYVNGVGEFCIRCHSPSGWLEGRSNPPTGDGLTGNDLNGIQCDVCHRMKNPMLPDTSVSPPVPGYGSGMMVVQTPRNPKRGPFPDAVAFHSTLADTFQRMGEFCAVCHDVSNPLQATNATTQPPHEYGVIERTFSEWRLSWYAAQGEAGTCQSCHMPGRPGYGATLQGTPFRPNVPKHDLTGGNTFLPDLLRDFWQLGADTARLTEGKARAAETLRNGAALEATAVRRNDSVLAQVRITNLTGHKLPTGYPEGRRMWLQVIGRSTVGDTLFRSGWYDRATADLTRDPQAKVYEAKPGLTAGQAARYGLTPGPSFHFVLNDTVYLDNRIPPRGFSNIAFRQRLAQPVGAVYADGQYWDVTPYILPSGVAQVVVNLLYQTSSKEYITFLRDENRGNTFDTRRWGDSLYASWERRGKSDPVIMESVIVPVTSTSVETASGLPAAASLAQNYPNPFNPSTTFEFTLERTAHVTLRLVDLAGREAAVVFSGRLREGVHRVPFTPDALPSGVYFYTLRADDAPPVSRKLVYLK